MWLMFLLERLGLHASACRPGTAQLKGTYPHDDLWTAWAYGQHAQRDECLSLIVCGSNSAVASEEDSAWVFPTLLRLLELLAG